MTRCWVRIFLAWDALRGSRRAAPPYRRASGRRCSGAARVRDYLVHEAPLEDTITDLTGKLALVTGATGGIGKAVATALARQGAWVAVVGRSEQRTGEAVGDIRARVPGAKLEPVILRCVVTSVDSKRP